MSDDNPALATKVMSVGTPAERAEILKAAGVAIPTHADVNSHHASLSDVSGAGQSASPSQIPSAASTAAAASAL